jgi:hypothetical protein
VAGRSLSALVDMIFRMNPTRRAESRYDWWYPLIVRKLWREWHRPLMVMVAFMLGLSVVSAV